MKIEDVELGGVYSDHAGNVVCFADKGFDAIVGPYSGCYRGNPFNSGLFHSHDLKPASDTDIAKYLKAFGYDNYAKGTEFIVDNGIVKIPVDGLFSSSFAIGKLDNDILLKNALDIQNGSDTMSQDKAVAEVIESQDSPQNINVTGEVMSKFTDYVMGRNDLGQGKLPRLARFGGRRAKAVTKNCAKGIGYSGAAALEGGAYLTGLAVIAVSGVCGFNTALDRDGYQFSTQGQTLEYVSVEDDQVTIAVNGQYVDAFQSGDEWVDSEWRPVAHQQFTQDCWKYKEMVTKHPERKMNKPSGRVSNLIPWPTLVSTASDDSEL